MNEAARQNPIDLAVRCVESDAELRQATGLMRQAEWGGAVCCWPETHGVDYSPQERARVRVAVLDGEVAGALRLHSEVMRLGEARLRVGQLSLLSVEERFRGKGVQRALIGEMLVMLKAQGYHMALLCAAPGVHYPLGFANAYPEHNTLIDTGEAVRVEGDWRARPAKPGDIPAMSRMHNANDSLVDGALLRPEAAWPERWPHGAQCTAVTDPDGALMAYFVAEPESFPFRVLEAGIVSAAAAPALLAICGDTANDAGASSISFHLPPAHPLAAYLRHFSCTVQTHYSADGGPLLALCDVGETLESLVPEWESLIGDTIAVTWRNEVTLVIDGHAYRIRNTRGALDIAQASGRNKVSLSRQDLVRLVMGLERSDDLLSRRKGLADTEARTLLRAIFPQRHPHLWQLDRL